jgi:hypothetical protein
MVAQLGQPENHSVCSEMHEVRAVCMMCAANATPGIVHCPLCEYLILSRGLLSMRCLVVLQDEAWAVLCLLTNKSHKLNLEPRNHRNWSIYIPSSSLHLLSLFLQYDTHRQHPDLDITWLAQNKTSPSKTHTITYTTLYFPSGLPSITTVS